MAYGAGKAAQINLTKTIASGFSRDGATAVCIAPGLVRHDMAETFFSEQGMQNVLDDISIGDMAEPTKFAELVTFVLRPGQGSLKCATLDVNGGSYIR